MLDTYDVIGEDAFAVDISDSVAVVVELRGYNRTIQFRETCQISSQ